MQRTPSEEPLPWISVSDLAEYSFCPRAHWYRLHPPREPPEPTALRASHAGEAFHRHALSAVRRRERIGPAVGLLALGAGVLLVLALLLAGSL